MPNANEQPTKRIAWHHFKLQIPSEWEVTAYSVEDREGRLELSTKRGFEAMISWAPCRRRPDTESMMVEFLRSRVPGRAEGQPVSIQHLKTRHVGEFFLGYHSEELPAQAFTVLKEEKKLLRIIFDRAAPEYLERTVVPMLRSFTPNHDPIRDYALYGLCFSLPDTFSIEDMVVLPANVMMTLENTDKVRATFRRWGMPEVTLGDESLDSFCRKILHVHGCHISSAKPARIQGMEALRMRYEQRGQHQMDKFLGRLWKNGHAWVWLNSDEHRIYAFETIGPPRAELPSFETVFPELGAPCYS